MFSWRLIPKLGFAKGCGFRPGFMLDLDPVFSQGARVNPDPVNLTADLLARYLFYLDFLFFSVLEPDF